MKVTIVHADAQQTQAQYETSNDMSSLLTALNQNQFVMLSAQRVSGPSTYTRVEVIVNRDDIAQIMPGWVE